MNLSKISRPLTNGKISSDKILHDVSIQAVTDYPHLSLSQKADFVAKTMKNLMLSPASYIDSSWCMIEGCRRKAKKHGFCYYHQSRKKKK